MALCTDTQSTVVDAVDQSAREVFQMMAAVELQAIEWDTESTPKRTPQQSDITVVMGLTGDLQGSVVLTTSEAGGRLWASTLLCTVIESVDQDVIDAIGELGNMVVGGAKRRLTEFELTMSLPSVLTAGMDRMHLPSRMVPIYRDYEFEGHPLSVLIALRHS